METGNFAVLATDVAVLTTDGSTLKVLLTRAKSKGFFGMPTLPGALVGHKETTEEASSRVLKDVMTSTNFYSEQLFTFDDPSRDPTGRVVSVAYFMLVPWNKAEKIVKGDGFWQEIKSLPSLAYDHNEIVKHAVGRLKGKLKYTNIIYSLMPAEFRLSDLQKVYESVLETTLDKRNFVKKIKSLKLLARTGKKIKSGAHRPANLYKFVSKDYKVVGIF